MCAGDDFIKLRIIRLTLVSSALAVQQRSVSGYFGHDRLHAAFNWHSGRDGDWEDLVDRNDGQSRIGPCPGQ